MTLSIIIPVFNAANDIQACLQSIVSQTFNDYEVLLQDGLSTDDTALVINAFALHDERIRFNSEKDHGIYDAMNKGIARATGEWVYFMGSDDRFHDNGVLQKISSLLNPDVDLVYGVVQWVPENRMEQGEWNYQQLLRVNINHQRVFYRRSLFEQYGGYELQYKVAADHALNIRLFCNEAVHKKYISVVVTNYHSGGFSASKTDEVFWKNWDSTVLQYFRGLLPMKEIYGSLNSYYRYLLQQKQYGKAVAVAAKVFIKTKSPGFVKLAMKQFFQSINKHAS